MAYLWIYNIHCVYVCDKMYPLHKWTRYFQSITILYIDYILFSNKKLPLKESSTCFNVKLQFGCLRTQRQTHTHTFTHMLDAEYSGVRCLFCGRVFSWQSWVIRVSVRACPPACALVCAYAVSSLCPPSCYCWHSNFYILFTNCHHYRDYHRVTEITFMKGTTS